MRKTFLLTSESFQCHAFIVHYFELLCKLSEETDDMEVICCFKAHLDLGMVMHICNLGTLEADLEELRVGISQTYIIKPCLIKQQAKCMSK